MRILGAEYNITRATRVNKNDTGLNNILLKCIDDSINNKICLSIIDDKEKYIDNTEKLSFRSYAVIVVNPKLSTQKQKITRRQVAR